jgi:hypothetical protein
MSKAYAECMDGACYAGNECSACLANQYIEELEAKLEAIGELPNKWKREAMKAVPPEYANRDLHRKYLNCDNYAGGQDDCADELQAILEDGDET